MVKTGVLLIALCLLVCFMAQPVCFAQGKTPTNVLADLKITYPDSKPTDKVTFSVSKLEKVQLLLSLPVLSGSNKAYIGLLNFITKEEIWGKTVDASLGPVKVQETISLKPGTYRILYEFTGETDPSVKAQWSGTLTISK